MSNVNIALLTALYNGQSNLYKEIYFPIVKFALACCLKEAENKRVSSIDELYSKINIEFGIFIPRIVIKKAISHMTKTGKLHANLMGCGSLQVREVDMTVLEDTYNKEVLVDSSLQRLEQSYVDYFEKRNIIPEKSFVEFFSAKTQEIEEYLGSKKPSISMGEEYTHNVRYLSWLKDNDIELYESANKVLWGAIVAGFLSRDNYEFEAKPVSGCRYYLDTSIIMGGLDLSFEQTSKYSLELIQIIKSSSSIVCVHPITLDEIVRIIKGVESEGGPRYGTSIYEAYERRSLTCSKLASIRLNLEDLIQDLGVVVLPNNEDVLKIKEKYRGKSVVKKLEVQRSDKGTGENPRDIHDVYMIDFIRNQNGNNTMREKVKAYFVTTNDDLRKFSFEYCNSPINLLIAPSSVILDLWLHGTNLQSQAASLSLTETMSRCLALNEETAIPKIRQILKCLDCEEMSDPKVRQEVVNGVIERSHKYISSDVEMEPNGNITPDDALRMYKQAEQELNEKEELEDKVQKLEKREEDRRDLKKKLREVKENLAELGNQRGKAINYVYRCFFLEFAINVIVVLLFVFSPSRIAPMIYVWKPEWGGILEEANFLKCLSLWSILTAAFYGSFLRKRSRIFNFKEYKRAWDREHPEYKQAKEQLKEIEQELEEL